MKTSDFDYYLPEELIAQTPLEKRDTSRFLVYNRKEDTIEHKHFYDVIDYLSEGDVLVVNNTKVIPARLYGTKKGTERLVEFLLLKRYDYTTWDVILKPGKKVKVDDIIVFSPELSARILEKKEDGVVSVSFIFDGVFEEILDALGIMPLPPYITEKLENKERYNKFRII